jgi:hypothetical protein
MTRDSISAILLSTPAWARVGLTMRDERMRERAADTIAAAIIRRMEDPGLDAMANRDQLALPL